MSHKKKGSTARTTSGDALAEAVRSGDHKKLQQLLSTGSSASSTVQDKKLDKVAGLNKPGCWPVLFLAAHGADPSALSVLCEAGANANSSTATGWTAAHFAAASSNMAGILPFLQALLERGFTKWDAVADTEHTPLSVVLGQCHHDDSCKEVVSFLVNQHGCYLSLPRTASARAAGHALLRVAPGMEILRVLFASPAFVPGTMLYASLVANCTSHDMLTDEMVGELVEIMLENGMAVNEPVGADEPWTPGVVALARPVAVEKMLAAGLLVNRRIQKLGCGLLHQAVMDFFKPSSLPPLRKALLRSMQLLLDHGADANLLDDKGSPALYYAAQCAEEDSRPALLLIPRTTNHPLGGMPARSYLACLQTPAADLVARLVQLSDSIVKIDRSVCPAGMPQYLATQYASHALGRVREGGAFALPEHSPAPQPESRPNHYRNLAELRNVLMMELLQKLCCVSYRTLSISELLAIVPVGRIPEAITDLLETITFTTTRWQHIEEQKAAQGSIRVLARQFGEAPVPAKAISKFLVHFKECPDNVGLQPFTYCLAQPFEALLSDQDALALLPIGVKALAGIAEVRKDLGLPVADWKPFQQLAARSTCMMGNICVFKRTTFNSSDPLYRPFYTLRHDLDLLVIIEQGFVEHSISGLSEMCCEPPVAMRVLETIATQRPACFAVMAQHIDKMCAVLQRRAKEEDFNLFLNVHSICRIVAFWGRDVGINRHALAAMAAQRPGVNPEELRAAMSKDWRQKWLTGMPAAQASELWPALRRLAAATTPSQVQRYARANRLPEQIALVLEELPEILDPALSSTPGFKLPVTDISESRREENNKAADTNKALNEAMREAFATTGIRQMDKEHKGCSCCGITRAQLLADGRKLSVCGGCSLEAYCGRDCQKQHWRSGH